MRKLLAVIAIVSIAVLCSTGGAVAKTGDAQAIGHCPGVRSGIQFYRNATWGYQTKMEVKLTKASKSPIYGCKYARWVADLWRGRTHRVAKAYDLHVLPAINDWQTSVKIVQRVYPDTDDWLLSCSGGEGGHGGFVMNHEGSGAGGWMQFLADTFYSNVDNALADVRAKGFIVSARVRSWYHPLGQALTAAFMRTMGWSHTHWAPSIDPACY